MEEEAEPEAPADAAAEDPAAEAESAQPADAAPAAEPAADTPPVTLSAAGGGASSPMAAPPPEPAPAAEVPAGAEAAEAAGGMASPAADMQVTFGCRRRQRAFVAARRPCANEGRQNHYSELATAAVAFVDATPLWLPEAQRADGL